MGIYNWFFGENKARPTEQKKESVSTTTTSCDHYMEWCNGRKPTTEQLLSRLQNEVDELKQLLKYQQAGFVTGALGLLSYEESGSIVFPDGTRRSTKTVDKHIEVIETKPKKSKAKK